MVAWSTGSVFRRFQVQWSRASPGRRERVRGDAGRRHVRGQGRPGRCRLPGTSAYSGSAPRPSRPVADLRGSPPGVIRRRRSARPRRPWPRPRALAGQGSDHSGRGRVAASPSPPGEQRLGPLRGGSASTQGTRSPTGPPGPSPRDRRLVRARLTSRAVRLLAGARCCWTQIQPPPPTSADDQDRGSQVTVSRALPWARPAPARPPGAARCTPTRWAGEAGG